MLFGKSERPASVVGESENQSSSSIFQKKRDGSSLLPPSSPALPTLPQPKESIFSERERVRYAGQGGREQATTVSSLFTNSAA